MLYIRCKVASILDDIAAVISKEKDPTEKVRLQELWDEIHDKYNEMESLDAIEIDW